MSLKSLLRDVRDCAIWEAVLPLGARPVLQVASSARLLIISQAPGKKVHETGIAWNDASGSACAIGSGWIVRFSTMKQESRFFRWASVTLFAMATLRHVPPSP